MARSLITKGIRIQADAQGNLPKEIELLHTGSWKAPWHGEWETTPQDIQEYVQHFSEGVGLVEADKQAHVNFNHERGEAAAWIPRVFASEDGTRLLGEVEWTEAGEEAIRKKKYRYVSAEFNPRSYPWEDPEQEYHFVANVVTAAALTNEPLHKKLRPVMASAVKPKTLAGSSGKSNKEGEDMNLEELRAKKKEELNEDQLKFLAEHKNDLTEEERKAFALEEALDETEAEKKAREEKEAEEAKKREEAERIEASRKGQVSISASELATLKANAQAGLEASQKLSEKEATDFVDKHISAGRIKSGQRAETVKMLLQASAVSADFRKQQEDFITGLPVSKVLASEAGNGAHGDDTPTVSDEETALAASFGNTPEEIAEFKKKQGESN